MRALAISCIALAIGMRANAQQAQAVRRIVPDTFWNTLDHKHPVVARIKPGEVVFTRLLDAGARDWQNVQRAQPSNPMVGPIYIEGAEPGDAIAITFRKVRPSRGTAWSYYRLGYFSLTGAAIAGLYPNVYKADFVRPGRSDLLIWDVDTVRGTVKLREPVSARALAWRRRWTSSSVWTFTRMRGSIGRDLSRATTSSRSAAKRSSSVRSIARFSWQRRTWCGGSPRITAWNRGRRTCSSARRASMKW